MDLGKINQLIPYVMQSNKRSLKATNIILATDLNQVPFSLNGSDFNDGVSIGPLNTYSISDESLSLDNWGDIDAHGFQILNQFRTYFPNTIAVMMDEETLSRF